jgi:hypothetical protein
MIQRHILGVAKLNDPMKMLAADVNKDGKLTATDLVTLRKVILGASDKMPFDESWRFMVEGQVFPDPNNPFNTPMATQYDIVNLDKDMNVVFNGYKVGDVNNSVVANIYDESIESRGNTDLILTYDDVEMESGQEYEVKLYSSDINIFQGLQMTLITKDAKIVSINGGSQYHHEAESEMYHISYSPQNTYMVSEDAEVMTLIIKPGSKSRLSELLSIGESRIMKTQSYLGEEAEIGSIDLKARSKGKELFKVGQNRPNPWQHTTIVPITMPERGIINVRILDNNSRMIYSNSRMLDKGTQQIELGKEINIANGTYILEVEYNDEIKNIQMIKIE